VRDGVFVRDVVGGAGTTSPLDAAGGSVGEPPPNGCVVAADRRGTRLLFRLRVLSAVKVCLLGAFLSCRSFRVASSRLAVDGRVRHPCRGGRCAATPPPPAPSPCLERPLAAAMPSTRRRVGVSACRRVAHQRGGSRPHPRPRCRYSRRSPVVPRCPAAAQRPSSARPPRHHWRTAVGAWPVAWARDAASMSAWPRGGVGRPDPALGRIAVKFFPPPPAARGGGAPSRRPRLPLPTARQTLDRAAADACTAKDEGRKGLCGRVRDGWGFAGG